MDFKDWLRENRKRRGMTLVDLQNKTSLSHAQLSRLETGKSELTLFSAVRILHALDLSWQTLFTDDVIEGDIKSLVPYIDMNRASDLPSINFNDVDALADSGLIQTGTASEVVVELIRFFLRGFNLDVSNGELQNLSISLYSYIGNIDKSSPGLPDVLKEISFIYPSELDPIRLREIYLAGGVLIMQDLSFYIKQLRKSKNISLRGQAKAIDMTHPALIALETRITDKVKFMDIINLDKSLELRGELILFSWRAAELYMGTTKIESIRKGIAHPRQTSEIYVIEKLVVISRLFLHYFPNNFEWLEWYREMSLSGFKDFK
jgi:transcriptional regulator with XRE-family HTH domain